MKTNGNRTEAPFAFSLRKRSLARELAAGLLLLILLVEGALLGFVYDRQSRFLKADLLQKADTFGENLSAVLSVPLWDFDDEQIVRIGEGFAANELVSEIRITDADGKVLFNRVDPRYGGERIHRVVDILHRGQKLGQVSFSLSYEALEEDLVWLGNTILLIMAASVAILFIATGLLMRVYMRNPLRILQTGIDRVARGDYDYHFSGIRHQELVGIARRIEQMAAMIQEREASLTEINEELSAEIGERRKAEEKIRRSEAKSRALLDAMPDLMFQFDREGRFLDFRGQSEDLHIPPRAFVGKRLTEVFSEERAKIFTERLENAFSTGHIQVFEYRLPIRGEMAHFECRLMAAHADTAIAVVRNITKEKIAAKERTSLEEQLRNAQKMEAIGTLAGGVAHDLNNVLSGLVSYPELILKDIPEDSPLRGPIQTIQRSGEKAASIVQDLLTLARRGVATSKVVSLNDIIEEYLSSPVHEKLTEYHVGCVFHTELSKDLLNILGSPLHLGKAVMNLVSNAAEAMPAGGTVTIRTENRYLDRPLAGHAMKEGEYVVLSVSDTGTGISDKDLTQIFEPFYTKKVMGRSGTGLGMAVVWGSVKDHDGHIDVRSRLGEGTVFTLYFPATREKKAEKVKGPRLSELLGKGEKVLVVDDVPEQREIALRMLESLGYRAEAVESGEAAVAYVTRRPVDIVILDMIMDPGIDGLETFRRILSIRPGQRAVIASGFTESERVIAARQLGAGAYVRKPYLMEKLAAALHGELNRADRP